MNKKLLIIISIVFAGVINLQAQTTFNYTGSQQYYVVPPCIYSVNVQLSGAQGGDAVIGGATGGLGGSVMGDLSVNPGDTLWIYVGGTNGYNGGGQGGIDGNDVFSGPPIGTYGGWGGGASDIRLGGNGLVDRVAIAGGGGGAGNNGVWPGCQVAGPGGNGGAGGGSTGGTGTFGVGTPCNCAGGGGDGALGGSQIAGGIHGNYYGNTACLRASWGPGADGALGIGGTGSLQYHNGTGGGGGGGGGYYGGGAGGNGSDTTPGGGGGGGSSFTGTLSSASSAAGTNSGNGVVIITAGLAGSLPSNPGAIIGGGSYCEGDTINMFISPVSGAIDYTWNIPSGSAIIGTSNSTNLSLLIGSTSGYVFANANNACGAGAADSVMITANLLPNVSITASEDTICNGVQIALQGNGATGYIWSSGGNLANENVSPTANNTYTVTGTDGNNCSNTASIDIVVNQPPTIGANASSTAVCVNSSNITLTGTPSGGTWSGTGVAGNNFTPSTVGTFYAVYSFTDNNGCNNSDSVMITVNGCAGIEGDLNSLHATIYPNPSNGLFTLNINSTIGDVKIIITDVQGRVVYQSIENNVQSGYIKTISLEKERSGVYLVQLTSKNETKIFKMILNK